MKYLTRTTDKALDLRLEAFGATLIVGPKWCGKTTTAEQKAQSVLRMQDPDTRDGYLATARTKPSLLLKGDTPRLIDEWQVAPVLWDAVRTAVDSRGEPGLFILTGSTTVDRKTIQHSGTGRIAKLQMYPMSLYESGAGNGSISLKSLFNDKPDIDGIQTDLTIEELIFNACVGGWPAATNRTSDAAKLLIAKEYVDSLCESDISTVDGTERNPTWARVILRSYARNISTLAKKSSIYKDVVGQIESMSANTLDSYLSSLEKLFVIEDVEAWCPAIRSATSIRSGRKREFTDPSIAVASLGLSPQELEQDFKTFGFIFECLCMRDLKVYSEALGGRLSYYRDRYNLEADAVLHLSDGRYALVEFKLGSSEIEQGATHLLKIRDLVHAYNQKERQVPLREPDLLMVITGGNMAYARNDEVHIIPIGCLCP